MLLRCGASSCVPSSACRAAGGRSERCSPVGRLDAPRGVRGAQSHARTLLLGAACWLGQSASRGAQLWNGTSLLAVCDVEMQVIFIAWYRSTQLKKTPNPTLFWLESEFYTGQKWVWLVWMDVSEVDLSLSCLRAFTALI